MGPRFQDPKKKMGPEIRDPNSVLNFRTQNFSGARVDFIYIYILYIYQKATSKFFLYLRDLFAKKKQFLCRFHFLCLFIFYDNFCLKNILPLYLPRTPLQTSPPRRPSHCLKSRRLVPLFVSSADYGTQRHC